MPKIKITCDSTCDLSLELYTLLYDIGSFQRMMKYILLTYTIAIVTYLIWPTCQELRPVSFERDNFLTRFIAGFYQFDINTNVCPSIHVIGSLAVMEAGLWSKKLSKPWKVGFVIAAFLICISTVFMKQHSVMDILAAVPVCLLGHLCFFRVSSLRK